MSEFSEHLKSVPEDWRMAVIEVADSMDMMRMWFEGHNVDYTAADLIVAAKMVEKRMEKRTGRR